MVFDPSLKKPEGLEGNSDETSVFILHKNNKKNTNLELRQSIRSLFGSEGFLRGLKRSIGV